MHKLNAGIIGCGVGEAHIEGFSRNSGCVVSDLCDFDADKRALMQSKYKNLNIVAEAEDIIRNPKINIVSIASFDNFHAEQVIQALEHDKHVFVEKPLCLYKNDAKKIRALLNAKPHLKLGSNLILRKSPRFIWLKNEIESGRLGQLNYCEADYNYGRIHKITEGWRGQIDYYSVFFGGGIHVTDLLMWLTGQKPVEVMTYGNNIATEGTQFKYNDLVVALLKFESGLIAKVVSNYSCVYPHFHRLMVYGSEATFQHELNQAEIIISRDAQVEPKNIDEAYPGTRKGDLLADFVSSIIQDKPAEVSCDDVFNSMSVCFAVEESMNTGKPVKVDYI
jgi:predicted dehydrogenase